jgi:hypothetical protein
MTRRGAKVPIQSLAAMLAIRRVDEGGDSGMIRRARLACLPIPKSPRKRLGSVSKNTMLDLGSRRLTRLFGFKAVPSRKFGIFSLEPMSRLMMPLYPRKFSPFQTGLVSCQP